MFRYENWIDAFFLFPLEVALLISASVLVVFIMLAPWYLLLLVCSAVLYKVVCFCEHMKRLATG